MWHPETVPDSLRLQHEGSHLRTANADPLHPLLSPPSEQKRRRGERGMKERRERERERRKERRGGGGGGRTISEQSYNRKYRSFHIRISG